MNNKSLEFRDESLDEGLEFRDESLETFDERLDESSETLDKLINSLQGQQPKLDDEDAFIDSIMDSLPDLEDKRENASHTTPSSEVGGLILILRTVSSIAAMLIIGLFIFQNIDNSDKAQQSASVDFQLYGTSIYSEMSKCTTPQEAIKQYADKKQRSINKLISMYNDN